MRGLPSRANIRAGTEPTQRGPNSSIKVPVRRLSKTDIPEETSMSNLQKLAAVLLCGTGIALAAAPASAMPANAALKSVVPGAVENVRWGGWHGGGWHGRGWGWGLGGFAAGAIIGSAIAAPYYYGGYYPYGYYPAYGYPPPPAYYGAPGYGAAGPAGGDASYCAQRYRSYDPATGTFLGYDGQRHPCP